MDKICEGKEVIDFPKTADPEYTKKARQSYDDDDYSDEELDNAPYVVGKTLGEARSKLWKYKITTYYEFSDTVEEGYIISQTVKNGRINLAVSKGKKY